MELTPDRNRRGSTRLPAVQDANNTNENGKVTRLSNPPLEQSQKFVERKLNDGGSVTNSARPRITPVKPDVVQRHRFSPTTSPELQRHSPQRLPTPPPIERTGMRTTTPGEFKEHRLPPTPTPRLVPVEKRLPTTTPELKFQERPIVSMPKVSRSLVSNPTSVILPEQKTVDAKALDYKINSAPWTEKYPSYQPPLTIDKL